MYMDEKELRPPHDSVDGELLRRLLEESPAERVRPNGGARGCDGMPRTGRTCIGQLADRRCDYQMMPRRENAVTGNGNTAGGCHDHSDHTDHHHGEIGNTYPCGENGVHERALAMVYAPVQHWRNAYDPQTALSRGTLFRELDMPFYGKSTSKGGNCRGY